MSQPRRSESRAAGSRKAEKREMPATHFESLLYIPKHKIPEGMSYKWVRLTANDKPDEGNWQRNIRSGWTPVKRAQHADLFPFLPMPGMAQESEVIIQGGLILCQKETALVEKDRQRQERKNLEDMEAIAFTLDGAIAAPVTNESDVTRIERVVAEFKED